MGLHVKFPGVLKAGILARETDKRVWFQLQMRRGRVSFCVVKESPSLEKILHPLASTRLRWSPARRRSVDASRFNERRHVAYVDPEFSRLEHPSHDLPAARLRERGGKDDRSYNGNGPELVPYVLSKLLDELWGLRVSLFEDDKRLYDLPSDRVGCADHGCLRHRRVAHKR